MEELVVSQFGCSRLLNIPIFAVTLSSFLLTMDYEKRDGLDELMEMYY